MFDVKVLSLNRCHSHEMVLAAVYYELFGRKLDGFLYDLLEPILLLYYPLQKDCQHLRTIDDFL